MGGYGSGQHGRRRTIEGCHSLRLDVLAIMRPIVARMRELGVPGPFGPVGAVWSWSRNGERWAQVYLTVQVHAAGTSGTLRLRYDVEHAYAPTGPQDYAVELVTTRPYYGGLRWWFVCPAQGRLARMLYLPNGGQRFLSRQAYRLDYGSQRASKVVRAENTLRKLCRDLGGEPDVWACSLPPKPPRMRWATYNRMMDRAWAAQDVRDEWFIRGSQRFLGRRG